MSPSEFDLRAALHDGESGDDLNVDQLIQQGRARVTQRRVRLISGAAMVAVVAGIATGGVLLVNNSNGSEHSSANQPVAGRQADSATGGSRRAAPAPAGGGATSQPSGTVNGAPVNGGLIPSAPLPSTCPRTPPRYLPPPGGSLAQTGGPLFSEPVTTVVVCGYRSSTPPSEPIGSPRLVLHDGAATRLVASLESAPKVRPHVECPLYRSANALQISITGIAADGKRAGTVTTVIGVPGCQTQVTNGTAVRYNWTAPADVARRLAALQRVGGPVTPAPVSTTK